LLNVSSKFFSSFMCLFVSSLKSFIILRITFLNSLSNVSSALTT
jgi:hypothetical protein